MALSVQVTLILMVDPILTAPNWSTHWYHRGHWFCLWHNWSTHPVPLRYPSGTPVVPLWYPCGNPKFLTEPLWLKILGNWSTHWYHRGHWFCLWHNWSTHPVPLRYPSGTPAVPLWYSSGTPAVPLWYPFGTPAVTQNFQLSIEMM